jgi:outer membrane lipoprotein SlyB
MKTLFVLILSLSLAVLSGCANQSSSASYYTHYQARSMNQVSHGVVQAVRPVTIQAASQTGVGSAVGAALSAAAGMFIGGGRGQYLAATLAGSLGAVAGNFVERSVSTASGIEVVILLDYGRVMSISQEADLVIQPGQRVRIHHGDGASRAVPV